MDSYVRVMAWPTPRRLPERMSSLALASASGLNGLTPQERQIIRLAAGGLSNREIAQRLYLSPRTVASHLYRSFPKLGVAGRNQLHGLIPAADRAASTQIRTTTPAGKEPSP